MEWKPDKQANLPVYRQIAKRLEEQIVSGELSPGTPLPAERTLARQYGVNRGTVTAAYEELRASGLLQSWQGSGTWVSRHLWGVKHVPNWHTYTNGGAFLPTYPLVKRIREACLEPSLINLAKAELAPAVTASLSITELGQPSCTGMDLGYSHPKGNPALRERIAKHVREQYGIAASPEEILVTSGAQQALHLISLCLLSPGDAVAMEGPSYAYSLPLFSSAGLRLYRLPMDQEGALVDEIHALHQTSRIRMVFVNPTYQNPTGIVWSQPRRHRLLEICRQLRIPLVEDDAYGALTLAGCRKPPAPIKAMDEDGVVLYVNSLSKTMAPGLRIGWLVGPVSVIDRLADAKQQMDFGTSGVSQQLAKALLETNRWSRQIDTVAHHLRRQLQTMQSALRQEMGEYVAWNSPEGSYHLWCRLHTPVDEQELLDLAIREGVVFTPGGVYGAEPGWLRLTYSWEAKEALEEGIRRLAKALGRLL